MAHKKLMSAAEYDASPKGMAESSAATKTNARLAGRKTDNLAAAVRQGKTFRGENMPRFKLRCGASTACSHK